MIDNNILVSLGLTENEVEVYIGFLKYPNSTPALLARKIDMDKSSAYRATDSLTEQGLLVVDKKKRGSTYRANDPEVLKKLYDKEKLELENKKNSLESFITELKNDAENKRSTYITLEEGLDSHIARMEESLDSKERLIRERFRNHTIFQHNDYIVYVKDYALRRRDLGIHIKQLEQDFGEMYQVFPEIMKDTEFYNKEVRKLPESFNDNNSIRIYDDVVNIMSYDEKNEFIVITIKDTFVSQLMKNMYDFVWSASETV